MLPSFPPWFWIVFVAVELWFAWTAAQVRPLWPITLRELALGALPTLALALIFIGAQLLPGGYPMSLNGGTWVIVLALVNAPLASRLVIPAKRKTQEG